MQSILSYGSSILITSLGSCPRHSICLTSSGNPEALAEIGTYTPVWGRCHPQRWHRFSSNQTPTPLSILDLESVSGSWGPSQSWICVSLSVFLYTVSGAWPQGRVNHGPQAGVGGHLQAEARCWPLAPCWGLCLGLVYLTQFLCRMVADILGWETGNWIEV